MSRRLAGRAVGVDAHALVVGDDHCVEAALEQGAGVPFLPAQASLGVPQAQERLDVGDERHGVCGFRHVSVGSRAKPEGLFL